MIDTTLYFTESLDLRKHPIIKSKKRIRIEYYTALSYIVNQVVESIIQDECSEKALASDDNSIQIKALGTVIHSGILKNHVRSRLELYKKQFAINNKDFNFQNDTDREDAEHSVFACIARPWRKKQRLTLMCDAALILLDREMVNRAAEFIKSYLSKRQKDILDTLVLFLYGLEVNNDKFSFVNDAIRQYRMNDAFTRMTSKKIIVTANMSAGKSTLINAIIGKPLARTSQEVCTGNICYMHNKPYEDGLVTLAAPELNLDASPSELRSYLWQGEISISACFDGVEAVTTPLCIIDTPGVNAALYKDHSKIAHQALLSQEYDTLLYIVSPTNLGTDAELKHLKWVAENIPKEKIVFILNKLDDFRSNADDIDESMTDLRSDLLNLGFDMPVICPISAYFGLLLKMKLTNQNLTEDEQDEYALLAKKFSKPKYDLSHYYEKAQINDGDTEEMKLYKKSGLYGLEKIIYGGAL